MKKVKVKATNGSLSQAKYGNCIICKRPLTNPKSVLIGMGPICASRQARVEMATEYRQPSLPNPISEGFIFQRTERGLATNVPWLVRHHSAGGFEIGYGGSGPADAALNIVEIVLRRLGYTGATMKCAIDGRCFLAAWEMHQEAKWEFIAQMPTEGGKIAYKTAVDWVKHKLDMGDEDMMQGSLLFVLPGM